MTRLIDLRLLLRVAVALALVALLLWRIDPGEAARTLRDGNYVYVIPGLALFGVAKLLVALRWRLMLREFERLPLMPMFGVLLVSNLANNVLPARIGDLIRVQVPAQRFGLSRARLAATVFATESLLDGVAFAALGLVGLALIDLHGFPGEVFWGLLGAVAGGLLAVIPLSHLKLQEGWTRRGVIPRLPDRARLAVEEAVPHFIDGLAVFRDPRMGTRAIALSLAIWMTEVAMFALFGKAFGVTLSIPAWMLVTVGANMISSVPITPSNVGAYEVGVSELVKALGIAAGPAGAFAIASHVLNIAWITVAGGVAMLALRLTPADVFSFGAKAAPPEPEPHPRAAHG